MRILTEKKLSLDILDTKTNIGHQKTGSWVKGHSLGYSIKIKKKLKKKEKKNIPYPFLCWHLISKSKSDFIYVIVKHNHLQTYVNT
jgi:hypothetical protein